MKRGLILIRGLPGSGKSTLAQCLMRSFGHAHLEADQFFMRDGRYDFRAADLPLAHQWCQNETRRLLTSGMTVIVSNTFTTVKELRPYFDIAAEFELIPQVIACQNEFGSIHNVPEETMTRMRQRWAWDISELFKEKQDATH